MDKTLLLFINREWTNPFLDRLMATFTSFDVWMPILFVAVVLLLWRGDFRARSFAIVTLLTIGFTDGVFTQSMKKLVDRPRPSQALAGVRESAVIGLPHTDLGEAVAAAVVLESGAQLDETALIARLAERLARYKLPRRVFVVDELPRNAMGKVQKNVLRKRFSQI